ncbi:acyl-CoA dehydrogenase family protein [Arthrobacter sp. NIO-1057]|uniref:acyl-CoA dehydrogenase family protein n=1 Tax=Arthrobacter sp. NIO-1057 TaxID=993071 RepID=UPI00071D9669|nr:acyl-CoA dehydrogenase family protein [Arthrobacter sp. NIO-1057]KSU65570.1 acyl-CoA dehydrogenase [Arthrobacter sp. NIO-1057]SCC38452.1 Acyl-CoA dehydrogenase [Arthrobacter sp. NIO-1057]
MSFGESPNTASLDFNQLSDPSQASAMGLDDFQEQLPTRQLLKVTPGPSADEQYDRLAEVFRPVFAQIAGTAKERDRNRVLPFEQVGLLNRERFGALRIPVAEGGYGARLVDVFRLLIELSEADSHVGQLWRAHIGFVENVLVLEDQELRSKWISRIAAGQIVGNAYTERGGNALGTLNTKASQVDGRWLVTGEKYYCTGTIFADWTTVAVAHPELAGRQIAVVSTQHSGVKILDDWDGFGQGLTGTGTTEFHQVPVDTFMPQQNNDPEAAIFQLVLMAVQAGIARAALNDLRISVQNRTRIFTTGTGVPVHREPQVLQLVGEVSAESFAADSVVIGAVLEVEAALIDPGLNDEERYAVCELAANRAQTIVQPLVIGATSKLFDGLGASSTSVICNLDRHWRNARTIATHNPAIYKARIVGDYEINAVQPQRLSVTGEDSNHRA